MKEGRRRLDRAKSEIGRQRVPLVGADFVALDREALLLARLHNLAQLGLAHRTARFGRQRRPYRVEIGPALRIECEAAGRGSVPQPE